MAPRPRTDARRTAASTSATLAVVLATVAALSGCTTGSGGPVDPDSSVCATSVIEVTPTTVAPGGTLTIRGGPGGCDPERDYELQFADDRYENRVEFTATPDSRGYFEVEFTVPDDYPEGGATVLVLAPFPPCPANASCAAAQASVEVIAE